jgi:hypothetical protein
LGEDDLVLETEDSSGSSINANEDCASVDLVGMGARGRAGRASPRPLVSDGFVDEEREFCKEGGGLVLRDSGDIMASPCGAEFKFPVVCAEC